jgi:3-oxocholest-4-en-26-oyl-CoA dehydrogenase beta subunit
VDFTPTEAQTDLAMLSRTILTDLVTADRLAGFERSAEPIDRTLWTELARAGVLAAALPEAAGGDGHGLLEQCAVLVELGRALGPAPYLESIVVGASAVARFGREGQVERLAGPAGRGELILTAALGDEAVTAEHKDGHWTLTGSRTAVAAAAAADIVLVPATLAETGATAVFLLGTAGDGVTLAPQQVAGSPGCARLDLDRAVISDESVLGTVAAGAEIADWLLERATVGACATQLGVCERAVELTAAYALSRQQFGRPIGEFQAVAGRLADAYIDLEALRLTMWQAAWRLSAALPGATEVATAKFWAADAGHRIAHTTVHIHGGVGIDLSHPVHRYFLAATYYEFWLGPATPHLRTLGRILATHPTPR